MKNEKMTEGEQDLIRFRLMTLIENNSVKSILKSPYLQPSPYILKFSFATFVKTTVVAILLIVLGFGGLTYASASALPGDSLYELKITVEKIDIQLTPTPAKKITKRYKNIEKRLKEVETLIEKKIITEEKKEIVEAAIKEETQNIIEDLATIKEENLEVAVQTEASVQELIETHQDIITNMIIEEGKTDEINDLENQLIENNKTIEEEFNADLKEMEKTENLDNIENYKKEDIATRDELSSNVLLIQNTEIIPDITSLTISAPELNTATTTPEKIDSTSATNTENESQNNY